MTNSQSGFVIPSSFDIRASSFYWFLPPPDRHVIFRIDCFADFFEATFFQDAGGGVGLHERVRANRSDTRIARCKVDQTLSCFTGVAFSLIIRRDAVADFDNAVRIGWRSESAHSD